MADPTDPFRAYPYYMATPARGAAEVTPDDDVDLSIYAKSLYIGGAGDLTVTLTTQDDGDSVTFADHPAGYAPLQVKRVWATGTLATDIVALFDYIP